MRRRGWPALGLLLTFWFALFACTPESRNSLPNELRVTPDARLLGAWRDQVDEDFRIQITQADPLDYLVTTTETVMIEGLKRIHKTDYRLRAFNVDGQSVLAIQEQDRQAGREPVWHFARHQFSAGGEVALFLMDRDHIRRLIESKRLTGTVRGTQSEFPDVLITATPTELVTLIQTTPPNELFNTRIGPFIRAE